MHSHPFLLAAALFTLSASAQTVTDIDGNVYTTVTINGREWMAENLATSRYQDGTPIPLVNSPTTWYNSIVSGARCFYWNDSALIAPDYGSLYNWNAVSSPLNVCPSGWHVPTDAEWSAMTTFLDPTVDPEYIGFTGGTGTDIGDQLKEAGEAHWDVGNLGTNSSGFTARGGGDRMSIGTFEHLNSFGYFWTSTYGEQEKAWCRVLFHGGSTIFRFILDRLYGASVRCVADVSTMVPEGRLEDRIQLFPNPARDAVTVSGDGPLGWVSLLDMQGREVQLMHVNAVNAVINTSGLASGPYVVRVVNTNGIVLEQVLLE